MLRPCISGYSDNDLWMIATASRERHEGDPVRKALRADAADPYIPERPLNEDRADMSWSYAGVILVSSCFVQRVLWAHGIMSPLCLKHLLDTTPVVSPDCRVAQTQ